MSKEFIPENELEGTNYHLTWPWFDPGWPQKFRGKNLRLKFWFVAVLPRFETNFCQWISDRVHFWPHVTLIWPWMTSKLNFDPKLWNGLEKIVLGNCAYDDFTIFKIFEILISCFKNLLLLWNCVFSQSQFYNSIFAGSSLISSMSSSITCQVKNSK